MKLVKLTFLIIVVLVTKSFSLSNEDAVTEFLYRMPFKDKRIPVAVIDTGIDYKNPSIAPYLCVNGHKDFTGEGMMDFNGHGTNIAWQIMKNFNKKKYCVLSLKYYSKYGDLVNNIVQEFKAFEYAIQIKVVLVNLSSGGEDYSRAEEQIIKKVLSNNIKVVVSAGNDNRDLNNKCLFFPACINFNSKNFHVVGSLNNEGKKSHFSNYGNVVTDWEEGEKLTTPNGKTLSGTSQATAVLSGKLLRN